jgi:Ni,Fe-hydrogenase III small subunit
MFEEIKVMVHNGKQFIPDLRKAVVPEPFRGRPEISNAKVDEQQIADSCPLGAITTEPFCIDLGKCAFCGECAIAFPEKIKFTNDHKISTNVRENLLIKEGSTESIIINPEKIRKEMKSTFGKSLKLRQVSAGGDNSSEMELGACGNANFDMGRFGIEFTASPRHADGIVVTGPISANMAEALRITWEAIPEPKIFVLCGVDAISGGIFADSKAIDRSILKEINVDLYVPGNPPHPLTFINGILDLTR